MKTYNFTASEMYSWVYSLSREMTGLNEADARLKLYVYETAIGNLTKNKIPVVSAVDDEFNRIDNYTKKNVLDSFILMIGIIDNEFPFVSQCIYELFRIHNMINGGRR